MRLNYSSFIELETYESHLHGAKKLLLTQYVRRWATNTIKIDDCLNCGSILNLDATTLVFIV